MKWTLQKPTLEAWHWFRANNADKRMVIMHVISADLWSPSGSNRRVIRPIRRVGGLGLLSRQHLRNESRSREDGMFYHAK